jgi:hypothetical protein
MMRSSINCTVLVCALIVASFHAAAAQTGSNCVFNSTMCTCLFGTTDGDCWDPIANTPGFCDKRTCDAGWTCDCDGDFYCHREPRTVSLVARADADATTAACTTVNDEIRIGMAGCKLGYFHPTFSAIGFNSGQCQVSCDVASGIHAA